MSVVEATGLRGRLSSVEGDEAEPDEAVTGPRDLGGQSGDEPGVVGRAFGCGEDAPLRFPGQGAEEGVAKVVGC